MIEDELLSTFEPFKTLDPAVRQRICEQAGLVEFPPRTKLFLQGEQPTGIYALLSGRVKLYRQSTKKCQILALPMPGDCFGAESIPTSTTNPYSAATLTQAACIHLSPDALHTFLEEDPGFQEAFLRLITSRLKQFVTLVHDLAFRDVTSRLALVLLARAEAEGQESAQGIYFDRLLSQQELAAMVGTAREVVYRTFKRFEADGLIDTTPSGINILDLNMLRQIATRETR